MVYAQDPPYVILKTGVLSFGDVQRLKRFARYFDVVGNAGRLPRTTRLLMTSSPSAFAAFLSFSDWLWRETRATHGIALVLVPRLRRLVRVRHVRVRLPWDRGAVSGVPCEGESPIRRWRRRCRARRAAASPADRASGTAPAPAPAARAARVARDAARARDDRVSGHAAREPLDCEPLVRLARDPQLRTQRIELRS
jgi:hypothetical protein